MTPFIGRLLMKDCIIDNNSSPHVTTGTNIANDHGDDDDVEKDDVTDSAGLHVMEITKIMKITSVITVITMMMKTAVMVAETLIITLMTVGSETAIRIKTAIDSSLQT